MANRFLGLDSINVLTDYIDNKIATSSDDSRLVTLHAYLYAEHNVNITTPNGGKFDPVAGAIEYPTSGTMQWNSLKNVIGGIGGAAELEVALNNGSIWMSVGTAKCENTFRDWSMPIKVSGQNGVSVQFKYTYNNTHLSTDNINNLPDTPLSPNAENRKVYVWTKYGDDAWVGPTLWSNYAQDATEIIYRYCVTATQDKPALPTSDNDSLWSQHATSTNLSNEKPYMWMTYKRIPAGSESSSIEWMNDPILFGHYAVDGAPGKDGVNGADGVKPNYSVTLYNSSTTINPKPVFVGPESGEKIQLDNLISNNPDWKTLPEYDDNEICWYVVLNVDGDDNVAHDGISSVYRFSPIDGKDGVNGTDGKDGADGKDGNNNNNVDYHYGAGVEDDTCIEISNFTEKNLYVSNSEGEVFYNITAQPDATITTLGYTIKIANIGTGPVYITSNPTGENTNCYKFIGSCTEAYSFVLLPQESVELVCYDDAQLLVIGKLLITINEPGIDSDTDSDTDPDINDPIEPEEDIVYDHINTVYYTSTDQKIVVPKDDADMTQGGFDTHILSNTYDVDHDMGIITFDGVVGSIKPRAFANCNTLHSIDLPSNITDIDEDAFVGCENLGKIIIRSETPPTIDVFADPTKDLHEDFEICVPNDVLALYEDDPNWQIYKDYLITIN